MDRRQRRARGCPPKTERWTVVVINRDRYDSHAARSFERALEMAAADRGDEVDVFLVCADDSETARLIVANGGGDHTRSFKVKRGG